MIGESVSRKLHQGLESRLIEKWYWGDDTCIMTDMIAKANAKVIVDGSFERLIGRRDCGLRYYEKQEIREEVEAAIFGDSVTFEPRELGRAGHHFLGLWHRRVLYGEVTPGMEKWN